MKIICNKKLLEQKIKITQKAINPKINLELLKSVLLIANNNELRLISYDLELATETYLQAEILEEGKIVINPKLLLSIIKELPDTFVEIETDSDNNVYINCLNSRFKIKGDSAEEYPRLPDVHKNELYDIPQDLLKNMINQTIFAISQDHTKPILMGELLEITGNKMSLTSIDGYRMAISKTDICNQFGEIKAIIQGRVLKYIKTLMKSKNNIRFWFDSKNAVFMIDDIKIITHLLEGEFINYKQLIPREYNTKIKISTKKLLNSLKRISTVSKTLKNHLVKMSIRDNVIELYSKNDKIDVLEKIDIELEGDYLDIGFNSTYLLEGLKNIESDEIYMEFTSNVSPCTIKSIKENYLYLLLPVRVSCSDFK